MKWFLLILLIIGITGCVRLKPVFWAKASDWADELDGTDDVPSVDFETIKKENNDDN
jgi:hypothetical protein